mmetsp:Transcript_14865/g.21137  ORF Transcript_14865/g.21137 Transcript_14865/m.21137 type:complete len:277 (+) Transcript_14865:147-977(+)
MTHASEILRTLSLSHHVKTFHEQSIESSEDVQLLSWEDLEELGIVDIDDRRRLWSWIEYQQMPPPQSKPSSCVDSLAPVTNKRKRSKKMKMPNAFSLRNLMTQAKSLTGSSVTIDVTLTLSDSEKRHTSRRHRRSPSSIPKKIYVEDPIPEFDYSSCCSQITEDDIIETSMSWSRHSGLCNDQNFLNEKSIPNVIPMWDDEVAHERDTAYNQIAEDYMIKSSCSGLCQDQSVFNHESVPVLIPQCDDEEDSVSQLTHSSESICSQMTELSDRDFGL